MYVSDELGTLIVVGIVVVAVFVMIAIFSWTHSRSVGMIEQWAADNSLRLVSSSRCHPLGTPFWLAGRGRTVYRVTMQDAQGNMLSGYALCGGWFMGLWSDRVEVKWDNQNA